MNGMFFGVLFVWIMLMIVRLTLPRVRIADGVMQVCYLILMPGLILASIIALYI